MGITNTTSSRYWIYPTSAVLVWILAITAGGRSMARVVSDGEQLAACVRTAVVKNYKVGRPLSEKASEAEIKAARARSEENLRTQFKQVRRCLTPEQAFHLGEVELFETQGMLAKCGLRPLSPLTRTSHEMVGATDLLNGVAIGFAHDDAEAWFRGGNSHMQGPFVRGMDAMRDRVRPIWHTVTPKAPICAEMIERFGPGGRHIRGLLAPAP